MVATFGVDDNNFVLKSFPLQMRPFDFVIKNTIEQSHPGALMLSVPVVEHKQLLLKNYLAIYAASVGNEEHAILTVNLLQSWVFKM